MSLDVDKENAPPREDARNNLSDEDREKFNSLVLKAREFAKEGDIQKALKYNQRAYSICKSEKLAKRIEKMEQYLAELGSSDEDGDEMVSLGDGYTIYKGIYDRLYEHQRQGVLWMWKIFKQRKGGILGDDMGLGKTIQVIAFLSGLFDMQKVQSVLIVMPVAVIKNWEREFTKWASGIKLSIFHDVSKRERERILEKHYRRGGVILTSYGMIVNNVDMLATKDGRDYVWDSVILDEGHKIKNPSTKCSKGLHRISARQRLILTGTPIQNNLKEMWALFDWTHRGSLLGTARTFGMEYENPITRARQKDATSGEEHLGQEMAKSLKKIIDPYFLRRTKAQVTSAKSADGDNALSNGEARNVMPTLQRKNDLVIWSFMSKVQQRIYEEFASSDEVRQLLNSTRSPLTALMVLKKICDHPRLLTNRQCLQLGLDMDDGLMGEGEVDEETQDQCAVNRIAHIPDQTLIEESGKMVFLTELLANLKAEGHRCLVFSHSRKMLDIIQKVIVAKGHRVARLDGTVRLTAEREEIIQKFSRNQSYSVFLLTTQVGGVGLTLTSADRVVIYDPSWNPATDAQAVDRAFRIGQEKNVVIYRLITCGSIEEKIYRRQIFKESVTKLTTGDAQNPYKYFTKQDLHELFTLDDPSQSVTQQQLAEIHAGRRNTDTSLDAHIAMLHSLHMYGISDHDLMFTKEAQMQAQDGAETQYVAQRVQQAHQMLHLENEENVRMVESTGKYLGPEANKVSRPGISGRVQNWQFPVPKSETLDDDEADLEKDVEDLHVKSESDSEGDSEEEHSPEPATSVPEPNLMLKIASGQGLTSEKPIVLDTPNQSILSPLSTKQPTTNNVRISDSEGESEGERPDADSDVEMVGDSMEKSSVADSFHTPDNSRSQNSSSSSSGEKRRERTPDARSAKKRRRSVAWTPGGGNLLERPVSPTLGQGGDAVEVVTEELEFSPKKLFPPPVQDLSRVSSITSDYESWKSNVPSNSTFCANRISQMAPSGAQEEIAEEEEEEEKLEGSSELDTSQGRRDSEVNGNYNTVLKSMTPLSRTLQGSSRTPSNEIEDSPVFVQSTSRKGGRRPLPSEDTDHEVVFTPRANRPNTSLPQRTPLANQVSTPRAGLPSETAEDSPIIPAGNRGRRVLISEEEEEEGDMSEEEDEEEEGDMSVSVEQSESSFNGNQSVGSSRNRSNVSRIEDGEVVDGEAEEEEEEEDLEADEEVDDQEEEDEDEEGEDDEEDEEGEDDDEDEEEEITEEQQKQYLELMSQSRSYYKQGQIGPALQYCLDALEVYSGDDRAQLYALKLQRKLGENENQI